MSLAERDPLPPLTSYALSSLCDACALVLWLGGLLGEDWRTVDWVKLNLLNDVQPTPSRANQQGDQVRAPHNQKAQREKTTTRWLWA